MPPCALRIERAAPLSEPAALPNRAPTNSLEKVTDVQACALRGGSAAPRCEPAALPNDELKRLRRLAAAMLCASAQCVWVALAFLMQQQFSLPQSSRGSLTGKPAAPAPAALMESAKRQFLAHRTAPAEFLWRLATVGQARSFEGRASDKGNLLSNLLTARSRTRAYDHVRFPQTLLGVGKALVARWLS